MRKTGDITEIPNEMNISWRTLEAILKHKYLMGTWKSFQRDPGMQAAVHDFFTNGEGEKTFYQDFLGTIHRLDVAIHINEARKIVKAKVKGGRGIYNRFTRDERKFFLETEYNRVLSKLAMPGGWSEDWRNKRESPELNLISRREFTAMSSATLKDIVNNHYCSVFIEVPHKGDFKVDGKYYVDVKRTNPRVQDGQKINMIAYGKDAEYALDSIARSLSPQQVEMTPEERGLEVLWTG